MELMEGDSFRKVLAYRVDKGVFAVRNEHKLSTLRYLHPLIYRRYLSIDLLPDLTLSTYAFGSTAEVLHAVEELGLEKILSDEMALEGRSDMTPAQRLVMILAASVIALLASLTHPQNGSTLGTGAFGVGCDELLHLWGS